MDELEQWRREIMVQRAREYNEGLERSGALDAMNHLASNYDALDSVHLAVQAVIDFDNHMQGLGASLMAMDALALPMGAIAEAAQAAMQWRLEPLKGINLEPLRGLALDVVYQRLEPISGVTAAIIRDAVSTPIGEILRYESTLAELGSSLIGLNRVFADVGATFTVTLGNKAIAEGVNHRARVDLPANVYEVDPGKYEKELTGEPPAQVIKLKTLEAKASLGSLSIVSTSQSWSVERSENSEGLHRFNFSGIGGDEMRRKVGFIADFTQWVMSDDESALERLMTSFRSTNGTSVADVQLRTLTAEIGTEIEPIGIRARRLHITVSRLERWDKMLSDYLPQGLTQAQIAELESLSVEAIKKDFGAMREHGLLPPIA